MHLHYDKDEIERKLNNTNDILFSYDEKEFTIDKDEIERKLNNTNDILFSYDEKEFTIDV